MIFSPITGEDKNQTPRKRHSPNSRESAFLFVFFQRRLLKFSLLFARITLVNNSLLLGRFQPFHKGHLDAVKQIFERFPSDFLFLGLGSMDADFHPQNPFTASERIAMIFATLDEAGISRDRYNIFSIPDIHRNALYPAFVVNLLPPFSRLFSGSPLLRQIFLEQSTLEVHSLESRVEISATLIREKIKKEEDISNLVPSAVSSFLSGINARERLLAIEKTNFE